MKGVQTNATTLEGLYHVICCSRIRSASVISTLCHLHNGHNPKKYAKHGSIFMHPEFCPLTDNSIAAMVRKVLVTRALEDICVAWKSDSLTHSQGLTSCSVLASWPQY
jgi:hypothetical protein